MSDYRYLTAEAMRTVSGQWLRNPDTHAILSKYPKTAAFLPDVIEVHKGICDALGGDDDTPLEDQLARLREQGAPLDARHDRKYRGSLMLLEAFIELADKTETAERLTELRTQLHANGAQQVNADWSAEADNAESVRASLSKATLAEMAKIPSIEGRTLADEELAWIKSGEALGPIAAEKAAIEHQLKNSGDPTQQGVTRRARLEWIKVARVLESNLGLIKGLPVAERSAVLGLLHKTAEASERRAVARREPADDAEQPATPAKGTTTD